MTKTLIFAMTLSLCAIGQAAMAGECTAKQWAEANSSHGHLSVATSLQADSVSFPVTELCVDGDYLRPKAGAQFPVGDDSSDDGALKRTVNWLIPIKGESEQCVYTDSQETCEWKKVATEVALSGKISVVDLGTESSDEVCTKSYSIPACN